MLWDKSWLLEILTIEKGKLGSVLISMLQVHIYDNSKGVNWFKKDVNQL